MSLISLMVQIYYHTTSLVMQLLNIVEYTVKFDSSYVFGFLLCSGRKYVIPKTQQLSGHGFKLAEKEWAYFKHIQ